MAESWHGGTEVDGKRAHGHQVLRVGVESCGHAQQHEKATCEAVTTITEHTPVYKPTRMTDRLWMYSSMHAARARCVSNGADYTMSNVSARSGVMGEARRQDFSEAILTLRGQKII